MKNVSTSNKPSIWLQLYFVLASLLGLFLIAMGLSSGINNLLLSTWLKPTPSTQNFTAPPQPYIDTMLLQENTELTVEQKQAIEQWQKDYQQWQQSEKSRDYEAENRRRDLAWAIAMLLTGIPIFAVHAPFVFRQIK